MSGTKLGARQEAEAASRELRPSARAIGARGSPPRSGSALEEPIRPLLGGSCAKSRVTSGDTRARRTESGFKTTFERSSFATSTSARVARFSTTDDRAKGANFDHTQYQLGCEQNVRSKVVTPIEQRYPHFFFFRLVEDEAIVNASADQLAVRRARPIERAAASTMSPLTQTVSTSKSVLVATGSGASSVPPDRRRRGRLLGRRVTGIVDRISSGGGVVAHAHEASTRRRTGSSASVSRHASAMRVSIA